MFSCSFHCRIYIERDKLEWLYDKFQQKTSVNIKHTENTWTNKYESTTKYQVRCVFRLETKPRKAELMMKIPPPPSQAAPICGLSSLAFVIASRRFPSSWSTRKAPGWGTANTANIQKCFLMNKNIKRSQNVTIYNMLHWTYWRNIMKYMTPYVGKALPLDFFLPLSVSFDAFGARGRMSKKYSCLFESALVTAKCWESFESFPKGSVSVPCPMKVKSSWVDGFKYPPT